MAQQRLEAALLGSFQDSRKKKWTKTQAFGLLFIIATTCLILWTYYPDYIVVRTENKAKERLKFRNDGIVESKQAVVAADDGRCSQIGISVLEQGGHAVDAAVATALCLGVVNPMASGIGGGSFMIVRSSTSAGAQAFDMRETAPLAASKDMYAANVDAKYNGALSMGVPGELAGLHMAWLKYGRLPWKTLFEPAIKLAKEGFVIAPYLGRSIASEARKILSDPGLSKVFAPNGRLLKAGDACYNVELGHTLAEVAEQGLDAFYNGTIGRKLIDDVKKAGGILTMEDLSSYKVGVTDAIAVNTMGYTILGMPPPSSGTVGLSLVLNIFESYGNINAANGPLGVHRTIEALKHMFAARMNLGDPNFVNVSETISNMLSSSFAKSIRDKIIDNTTFPPEYYSNRWSQLEDHGTSHFCVVDADRNAVSMTTSVNYAFGAGVLSPSTGIIINNEMGDFSIPTEITPDNLPPAPSNFIQPQKRPLSSMTPLVILKDNQLAGVIGGSGGMKIIPAVIQVFMNHYILGMEPLASVQSARVYHKLIPNVVSYENWTVLDGDHIELSDLDKHFLKERGHKLEAKAGGAICQLVVQTLQNSTDSRINVFQGVLTAVSDPRKDGHPAAL